MISSSCLSDLPTEKTAGSEPPAPTGVHEEWSYRDETTCTQRFVGGRNTEIWRRSWSLREHRKNMKTGRCKFEQNVWHNTLPSSLKIPNFFYVYYVYSSQKRRLRKWAPSMVMKDWIAGQKVRLKARSLSGPSPDGTRMGYEWHCLWKKGMGEVSAMAAMERNIQSEHFCLVKKAPKKQQPPFSPQKNMWLPSSNDPFDPLGPKLWKEANQRPVDEGCPESSKGWRVPSWPKKKRPGKFKGKLKLHLGLSENKVYSQL